MRRVLVTGSRTWSDPMVVEQALAEQARLAQGPVQLIHGGAKGADQMAHLFARRNEWPLPEVHVPKWALYHGQAGFIRNREMVNASPDVVLAFIDWCRLGTCDREERHGTHGAENCALLAREAGLRPLVWRP